VFLLSFDGCMHVYFPPEYRYEGIPKVVSACMDAHLKDAFTKTPTLEDILAVDEWARAFVREWKP